MIAVTGVTGKVGGAVAQRLLAAGSKVRAMVRDEQKGEEWKRKGCEIAVADIHDAESLKKAFAGVEGVFVMAPPVFDPKPGFPEAKSMAAALRAAMEATRPGRVVYLSTIGAQSTRENLLTQHTLIEKELRGIGVPITFLRPGWFMENFSWDVAPASEKGVIPSFLYPLNKGFPMVATEDIGRVAAELLGERGREREWRSWRGRGALARMTWRLPSANYWASQSRWNWCRARSGRKYSARRG